MKTIRKTRDDGHREALPSEYVLSAPLIGLLKRVGEGVANVLPARKIEAVPVRVRR